MRPWESIAASCVHGRADPDAVRFVRAVHVPARSSLPPPRPAPFPPSPLTPRPPHATYGSPSWSGARGGGRGYPTQFVGRTTFGRVGFTTRLISHCGSPVTVLIRYRSIVRFVSPFPWFRS